MSRKSAPLFVAALCAFLAQPAALSAIATTRAAASDSREPDIWATPRRAVEQDG